MKKIALFVALASSLFISLRAAAIPRPEYPRPQFERADWINLNGTWSYTFDFAKTGEERGLALSEGYENSINVPFCPESKLSGVGYKDFIAGIWYQRKVDIPASWDGKRIVMHFGGVDYYCVLYVNGKVAGRHWGGMSSFDFEITRFVKPGETANIVLQVEDDTRSRVQALGKQSLAYASKGCRYTRTTGIWQTVWMEAVAPCGLRSVYVKPDLDNSCFIFEPSFYALEKGLQFRVRILDGGKVVASQTSKASTPQTMVLPVKKVRTWSPEDPFLYDVQYEVLDASGAVVDAVSSYVGMRKVHIEGDRLYLNNKPVFLRFVLDQGFYPDGVWTAPSDDALKADIEMSMAVGFNGARLHQKVFEERFHYWADKLGYLTWGESASWGMDVNNEIAARNFLAEWEDIVARDRNHPSIIVWTPFNETWDRPEDPDAARFHDRLLTDAYDLTHKLDYRPVHDTSGGYHVKTDIWSFHKYNQVPGQFAKIIAPRTDGTVPTLKQECECPYEGQPYFLDEYGGIKWVIEQYAANTWGYGEGPKSLDEFYARLKALTEIIVGYDYISGYCYTQLTDVEQEQNGIYTYDRKTKFDPAVLRGIFTMTPDWAK